MRLHRFQLISAALLLVATAVLADEAAEGMRDARRMAKPWYMHNIELSPGMTLPVSPVTVAVLFLSVFYLAYFWSGKPVYVVASHILLDKDPEAESKMEVWKEKIGKDATSFAKFARAHSSCPSKRNGGMLGKFKKHDMTPKFDKLCFDPATPIKTAVGPIRTQFGWHLVFIHERELGDKY